MLPDHNRTSSDTHMKSSLTLPSLASHRKVFHPCLFHRIFYHPELRSESILELHYISSRLDYKNKVRIPHARTNVLSQVFFPVRPPIGTIFPTLVPV